MKSLVEAVLEKQARNRDAMIRREIRAMEEARRSREYAQRQLDAAERRVERARARQPPPITTGKCPDCKKPWPMGLHAETCPRILANQSATKKLKR